MESNKSEIMRYNKRQEHMKLLYMKFLLCYKNEFYAADITYKFET